MIRVAGVMFAEGEPLYKARLGQTEAEALATIARNLQRARESNEVAVAFVAFASWWLTRKDSRGPWTWKHLEEHLGLSLADVDRAAAIDRGLARLKRLPLEGRDGRTLWLFSCAAEGGLPVARMARAETAALRFVRHVVGAVAASGYEREDVDQIVGLASGYARDLPLTLRLPHVIELGAQLGATLWTWFRGWRPADGSPTIRWLERRVPNWRDELPMAVDDSQAVSLVGKMFGIAAAAVHEQRFVLRARVETELEIGHGPALLRRGLSLPLRIPEARWETLGLARVPRLFDVHLHSARGPRALAGRLEIGAPDADGRVLWWRPAAGAAFTGEDARAAMSVAYRIGLGRLGSMSELPGAEALPADLPWAFADVEDRRRWRLVGTGSGTVPGEYILVAIGEGMVLEEAAHLLERGWLDERRLVEVRGRVVVRLADGAAVVLDTGRALDAGGYVLRGQQANGLRTAFGAPYQGRPALWRTGADGVVERVVGVRWSTKPELGIATVSHQRDGELLFRRTVAVVPARLAVRLRSISKDEGEIVFVGHGVDDIKLRDVTRWGARRGVSDGPGPRPMVIRRRMEGGGRWVPLRLASAMEGLDVEVQVPVPEARLWTEDGHHQPGGSSLGIERLRSAVLTVGLPPGCKTAVLTLNTMVPDGPGRRHQRRRYRCLSRVSMPLGPADEDGGVLEVELGEHWETLHSALGRASDLDARLDMVLGIPGVGGGSTWSAAWWDDRALQIDRRTGWVQVAVSAEEGLESFAVRLDDPRVRVAVQTGDGGLLLPLGGMARGPWLLVVHDGRRLRIRPTLFSHHRGVDPPDARGELVRSARITSEGRRRQAIERCVDSSLLNLDAESRDVLEGYLDLLECVPASTFDAMVVLGGRPRGTAELLLMAAARPVERLTRIVESFEELGHHLWELPGAAWRDVLAVWEERAVDQLEERVQVVANWAPVALAVWLEGEGRSVTFAGVGDDAIRAAASDLVFLAMEAVPVNRRVLSTVGVPEPIRGIGDGGFNALLDAPVLAAMHVSGDQTLGPEVLVELRHARRVHPAWFDLGIRWWLAKGVRGAE